jgi:Anti-anti-sigma regulatory factor (antagonist of anti-sigma factor)
MIRVTDNKNYVVFGKHTPVVKILQRMDYIRLETSENQLRLIFLEGELVFNTTSFILEYIQKAIRSSKADRVILDISSLNHIDSTAVGMFISLKNEMQKAGKTLHLIGLTENVLRIFRLLDIVNFLELNAA